MSLADPNAAERSKAGRLRKRLKNGGTLEDHEVVWLDAYTARTPIGRPRKKTNGGKVASAMAQVEAQLAAESPSAPLDPLPRASSAAPSSEGNGSAAGVNGASTKEAPAAVPIAPWIAPSERAAPAPATPSPPKSGCQIPDCPACKGAVGGAICGTTGKTVWPKMSKEGAEMQAALFLGILRKGIEMLTDSEVSAPKRDEIQRMGVAIQEVTYRRASFIGAFDDLFMLGGCTTGFVISRVDEAGQKKAEPK